MWRSGPPFTQPLGRAVLRLTPSKASKYHLVLSEGRGEGIKDRPITSRPGRFDEKSGPEGESPADRALSASGGRDPEYFLDLILETLPQLEPTLRGVFLQKLLRNLAGTEVAAEESETCWQEVLRRRGELAEKLARGVSLRTAAVDYFDTREPGRTSVWMEHSEVRRLRLNAATDPLTGLYNRRLFDEYLSKELNRSRRYSFPMALLLFDLRNFKQANDTYGHSVGDEVLRSLAQACRETVRGSDYPCRIGGDEFALVLPQSESRSAHALAERIAQKFELHSEALAPRIGLGIDYGVAAYPEDGELPEALFEVADRNLYAHKRQAHRTPEPPAAPAETDAVQEARMPPPPEPARPLEHGPQPAAPAPPPAPGTANRRRYERVSLVGTDAYAVLRHNGLSKVVRVLDLSFGGASFLMDEAIQLPETFHARLHVPVMPEAEMKMRRVNLQRLAQGLLRVGCSFVS